jgi:hypothetical protein
MRVIGYGSMVARKRMLDIASRISVFLLLKSKRRSSQVQSSLSQMCMDEIRSKDLESEQNTIIVPNQRLLACCMYWTYLILSHSRT